MSRSQLRSLQSDRFFDEGRPLPVKPHPGAAVVHELSGDEEQQWRRWTPKAGDGVLVDLPDSGIWPGKVS